MINSKELTIHIASQWSKAPTGRDRSDGPSNGTDFRNKFLVPNIPIYSRIHIDLDGTDGYGSSFLDEAFAGLIRAGALTKGEFLNQFTFKSNQR